MLPVLLHLRKFFHVGQSKASEGLSEEQEQGNLLDRTPTPTSLEVRGRRKVYEGLNTDFLTGCDLH